MKEAYRILPVCAGDVSGIASALYELGGMVVIHDPSGCNSTYNTHDEIRWYDQESYIFISPSLEMTGSSSTISWRRRGSWTQSPVLLRSATLRFLI